jgi:hypothetical protein
MSRFQSTNIRGPTYATYQGKTGDANLCRRGHTTFALTNIEADRWRTNRRFSSSATWRGNGVTGWHDCPGLPALLSSRGNDYRPDARPGCSSPCRRVTRYETTCRLPLVSRATATSASGRTCTPARHLPRVPRPPASSSFRRPSPSQTPAPAPRGSWPVAPALSARRCARRPIGGSNANSL